MSHLFEQAEQFFKMSQDKVSVVKNNNEILNEISGLKDFKERVSLAEENWDKLGEGSSRTIFQMSDSLVLKVAHNEKGTKQNAAEMSMRAPCLNNVLAADPEGLWVIVRFTETMTEEDFKDAIGFGFEPFMGAIFWDFNNEQHDGKPKEYDEIIEHPLFKCLQKLTLDNQLQIGDMAKTSSWGMLEGAPVFRDFGLTKDIYADFYEDDNSDDDSSSSDASTEDDSTS